MKWYVLQFTATRFTAVFSHLERLNFSYYCPMVTERYRRPDKEISYRERLIPLFRGLTLSGTKTHVKRLWLRKTKGSGEDPLVC
jgi:hypothetical protein